VETLRTIREYLLITPRLAMRGHLFVASIPRQITLDSLCAVIDTDDVDDPDNPPFAVQNGLEYVLCHDSVLEVLGNLRQQLLGRPAPIELQFRALNFYIRNDAFIDLQEYVRKPDDSEG